MKRSRPRKFISWTERFVILLFFVFSWYPPGAFASPFEDTVRILENRTAFHWGRDCFVWVVHYAEALVDPWVESEAGRAGMSESDRAAYKDSFTSDLSIGKAEPVLVTVHAFGASPMSFSPFSEKISLVTSNGEHIKPTKYDRILDQPLSGVVQGLVFFPKQNDPGFAIAIRGMGVYDERIFSFSDMEQEPVFDAVPVIDTPPEEDEVVIVELPPAPAESQTSPPRAAAPAARRRAAETAEPPKVPESQEPEQAGGIAPENIEAMDIGAKTAEPEIVVIEPEQPQPAEDTIDPAQPNEPSDSSNSDVAYESRERTLRTFLDHWVKSGTEAMYSMLSDSSRKLFSMETFDSELKKSSDFRNTLRGGYTIEWLGSERAKVVTVRRILLIRTLLSRTLGVTREGSAWKIVW